MDSHNYFDICSDLHIDQWDLKLKPEFPCGLVKNFPLNLKKSDANILIIAGDISDKLELSINYMNKLSKNYDKILFTDGNHEHVERYPNLYSQDEINKRINENNNSKIVYLPKNPYIINETVFIGCCGWWDYCNDDPVEIQKGTKYFKNWHPHFTEEQCLSFINNVSSSAKEQYKTLKSLIEKYDKMESIKNVIIVTHTIPTSRYFAGDDISTELNSNFNKFFSSGEKRNNSAKKGLEKVTHWIFGHVHEHYEDRYNGMRLICNPRGRPEDHDREIYKFKTVKLSNINLPDPNASNEGDKPIKKKKKKSTGKKKKSSDKKKLLKKFI